MASGKFDDAGRFRGDESQRVRGMKFVTTPTTTFQKNKGDITRVATGPERNLTRGEVLGKESTFSLAEKREFKAQAKAGAAFMAQIRANQNRPKEGVFGGVAENVGTGIGGSFATEGSFNRGAITVGAVKALQLGK